MQHAAIRDKMYRSGHRLPLIEGGHLGGFNKYHYGNMVTRQSEIDWDSVTELTIPRFWARPENEDPES
jgi:hypothetical protein